MIINYSRNFKKMFKKHPAWVQDKFDERIFLFEHNLYHPLLNNHALEGKWFGFRSINITGDIRAVFEESPKSHFVFTAIGSHSELYS